MLTFMLLAALAADPPVTAVPLANVSCHDGDTLRADIVCPFGLTIRDRSIRAYGYDAWEINRTRQTVNVDDIEIERGKQAKAALVSLIATGTLYAVDTGKSDPHGRCSAELWVRVRTTDEWVEVAEFMRKNFHCRQ